MVHAVQQALQPFVDRHALAGAVALVADRDRWRCLVTVGYADVPTGRAMEPDSTFWIASMTKPFTATAVLMLVDEGRLALDDPVERYLPEFQGLMVVAERDDDRVLLRRPAHPITIRQILSHTSGLRFSSPVEQPTLDGLPLEVAVRSYAMMPLEFEPETQYVYCNAGINTAARILEVVTGESFEGFLQARLLDPLGLADTTFWPSPEQVGRLATVHRPTAAGTDLEATRISHLRYPLTDREHRYPMPGGGLFATAADCARFGQMILRGGELEGRRYLSAAAVAEMTRRQTAPHLETSYGLGWVVGPETFGHGGALATNLTIDPTRGLVLVYLVQHAGFPLDGDQALGAFHQAAREAAATGS